MTPMIVALQDRPSSNSFGMCPLIIKREGCELYEVTGHSSGLMLITAKEFNEFIHHNLTVSLKLPPNSINPVGLWLGSKFSAEAARLNAPALPKMDENWHQPLEPCQKEGWYSIKEPGEAYQTLEEWTAKAGIEALAGNNSDLASLMEWVLPFSPVTRAAVYFTRATAEEKQKELELQLRLERGARKNLTYGDLIREYQRTKELLLSKG